MPPRHPYPGLLGKKIKRRLIEAARFRPGKLGMLNDRSFDLVLNEWRAKMFHLLFLHYDIDHSAPDRLEQLAIVLALTHVPAFQVAEEPGAKRRHGDLLRDVEDIRKRKGLKGYKAIFKALQAEGKHPGEFPTLARRVREEQARLTAEAKLEKAVRASSLVASADALIRKKKRRK